MRGMEKRMEGAREPWKIVAVIALCLVCALSLAGLTGCAGGDNSSQSDADESKYENLDPVTLILSDCASPGSSGNIWSEALVEKANTITGGKLTIDYHGNNELGGDIDILRQEQSNDIQMVAVQPAPLVNFVPAMATFDQPMVFANYTPEQINTVLNGDNEFTQGLQAAYEENSLHNLGFLQAGAYRQATSNIPLNTLDDFKGFQIRTMENSNHMAFWQALGAEPTPLAFSEVYFALQNGTVDGQENPTDTAVGASLQEVQKYLAKTNHILCTYNMSISKEAWENLDPAYQEALTQALAEATAEIEPKLQQLDADSTQVMVDAGMEVIEYEPEFYETILNLDGVKALYADISKQTNGLSDVMVAELEKTK